MAVELLDLPQLCLEEIFKDLSYSEISQLGAVCRYFREVAKTIFRVYFRHQEDNIEKEMEKIEMEASKSEKLTVDEHLYLALLHSVLRILLSEAKMLKAHCWRYMRDPSYDFCFPAGRIIDEFEKILRSIRQKTLSKDMEPEISTTLFHLGEKFYDYFDTKIETHFHGPPGMHLKQISESNRQKILPNIYKLVPNATKGNVIRGMEEHSGKIIVRNAQETKEKTLFGVKLMDILDCCSTSDFHSVLYYNSEIEGFQINSQYKLSDVNVLQALPSVGLSLSNIQRQISKICCYIRNNVRWTNLFHPLQDLWILEDTIEISRNVNTASALLKEWRLQQTSSRLTLDNADNNMPQYNYRRIVSRFKTHFGFVVTMDLECPKTKDMPLKIKRCLDSRTMHNPPNVLQNNVNNTAEDKLKELLLKWNDDITMYKFHLELKIQYPSFLTDKVQEAILIVDQTDDETFITSNEDEVRKCATFRAEDRTSDQET